MGTFSINSPLRIGRRAKTPRPLPLVRLTSIDSDCVNAIRILPNQRADLGKHRRGTPRWRYNQRKQSSLVQSRGIRMQIGVVNHPARDPIAEIEWIGQNGFDFVDFTLEPPAADPDVIDPAAIRDALDRHKLGVVAHTAWFLPLGSPFAGIRQACLEEFRSCLRAAHRIGATVMNTHLSKPPPTFSSGKAVDWHAEVLGPLCEEAAALGVTIV